MPVSRAYGPSIILAVTALAVLLGGPSVMRRLAWVEADARIQRVRAELNTGHLDELNAAFRDVARVVEPSVVHIEVVRSTGTVDPGGFMPNEAEGNGSGWVYAHESGRLYVITNHHVVENAKTIRLKFYDRSTRAAVLLGADPKTDIAVLRSDGGPLHPSVLAPQPVEKGEIVFAFGSPFQFEFSMSQGIVMGKGRRIGILARRRGYENFIQTDASVNPGNSGGPLTNIRGQIVGMNTAIPTTTGGFNGMAFTIPVEMIRNVADQLIERGEVRRGYLGVWIKDLDPALARSFAFEGDGVLVEDLVGQAGPAEQAGIQSGDIITHLEGQVIRSAADLRRVVASLSPDQDVSVTVFRAGETLQKTVRLARLPEGPVAQAVPRDEPESSVSIDQAADRLGLIGLETMNPQVAQRFRLPQAPGVLVTAVRPGSAVDEAGLAPGTLITRAGEITLERLEDLNKVLATMGPGDSIRLRVRQDGQNRFLVLTLPR